MLNLSDKELDRLSREAASAHDPGEPQGAASWQKLELRLDKELGKVSPSPNLWRGFRRLSFYFAPAVILLVGVSYYFIRQGKSSHSMAVVPAAPVVKKTESSGGPPGAVIKIEPGSAPATTIPLTENNTDKSNSTPDIKTNAEPRPRTGAPDNAHPSTKATTRPTAPPRATPATNPAGPSTTPAAPDAGSATTRTLPNSAGAATGLSTASPGHTREGNAPIGTGAGRNHANLTTKSGGIGKPPGHDRLTSGKSGRPSAPGHGRIANQDLAAGHDVARDKGIRPDRGGSAKNDGHQPSDQGQRRPVTDPTASVIRKPSALAGRPLIDDSALRHIPAKGMNKDLLTIDIGKKNDKSLHIDRSLQLGFSVAPDFASVNSLAGDKPGSTIGITADYQFANRWYVGTGLLYSKRNYAARAQDYHVPMGYYGAYNMRNVNFVKGSFSMLEIPLNLRYDFSVAGNTSFFASGGVSSYLLSHETCAYYYEIFGREVSRKFSYPNHQTDLFSVINLSMGIETGISNSFSLLLAPYVKIPASKIGFGQIQMNSIGINFALKYAPVLKRKRK